MENRISTAGFAIVFLRVMYIICFVLGIPFLCTGDLGPGLAFVIMGIVVLVVTLLMKKYRNNLKNAQNAAYAKKLNALDDSVMGGAPVNIDTSKISFSEADCQRAAKNCKVMEKKKLPYKPDMLLVPFDGGVSIKSKEVIVLRMVSEMVIAHKSVNKLQGVPDTNDGDFIMTALKFCAGTEVMNVLSAISNGEVPPAQLGQWTYLYERVNTYMWVLGLGDKPLPNKVCSPILIEYLLGKYDSRDALAAACKMRSYEDIMEYADLISRYDWARIELAKNASSSKSIQNDSVMEQKCAMDFVTGYDANAYILGSTPKED